MWEMGGGCPRHDPDNYEPSPYIIVPDKDAHEDANTLERQAAEIKRLRATLGYYSYADDGGKRARAALTGEDLK
jgi:hypothetical protein